MDDDVHSLGREGQGYRSAQPLGGAGDEGGFVTQWLVAHVVARGGSDPLPPQAGGSRGVVCPRALSGAKPN